ncbi:MAG: hypothetical protein QF578_03020 [Alphaproteobacteria bacterium]|nr:hypothetical protein [Alphaproteobacteria bacterium]MDP6814094.1 hypothetical protein [Alphaproteobacteria bacterium]
MRIRNFISAAAAVLALVGLATTAMAAPVTTPAGIGPGDQYRLAFVTSLTMNPQSSDIADYNDFVTSVANGVAELAALGTTWTAIGSTASVDARDNTSTNPNTDGVGVPIYLLDGTTKIADDYADLWDGHIAGAIAVYETGAPYAGADVVWTGTDNDGTASPVLWNSGPLGSAVPTYGDPYDQWAWVNYAGWAQTDYASSIFAISGLLPVPASDVPAPGGLVLFGFGLAVLVRARRRSA